MRTNILTLRMDRPAQQHFDRMRETHYPPALNQIAAHLTLFHSLPDSPEIAAVLATQASAQQAFSLQVTGVRSLGRGVAYRLQSPQLLALHGRLSDAFSASLIAQDRQRFDPHVVIQNKVSPPAARALLCDLQQSFKPFAVEGKGLDLWHYLGGPWQHAATVWFVGARSVES